MAKTLFLVKANDDLISHCSCPHTEIGGPVQFDCPWCGCGWLCNCPICGKAFTFARAEEVDKAWEELAHRDLDGRSGKNPTRTEIKEWISGMKVFLKGINPGAESVYLDSFFIPIHAKNLKFDGWYAHHELDVVPQFLALAQPETLDQSIDSERYW